MTMSLRFDPSGQNGGEQLFPDSSGDLGGAPFIDSSFQLERLNQ